MGILGASNNQDQVTFQLVDCAQGGDIQDQSVGAGSTLLSFLESYLEDGALENTMVRVNREQVHENYVLKAGDRVSLTPAKVSGATN